MLAVESSCELAPISMRNAPGSQTSSGIASRSARKNRRSATVTWKATPRSSPGWSAIFRNAFSSRTGRARRAHGEFAGGVDHAEQHIGDGVAAFAPAEPGMEDGVGMAILPFQRERSAAHGHHHQRLASLVQRLEQLLLARRKTEIAARRR